MKRPHWPAILLFVFGYKLGEAMAGVMAMPLYIALGFSLSEIAVMSKLNEAGQWVDKIQSGNPSNPLFEKMSKRELLHFAETGELPEWVTSEERESLS